jgi:hypothetical protein
LSWTGARPKAAAAVLEALSRGAFDRELARLDKRVVKRRNWTVLSAQYPVLDVVFNHATRAPLV